MLSENNCIEVNTESFYSELKDLCSKYGISISHEDGHGSFIVKGYRCVMVGQRLGHRCGYIGLPKGHKYYGKGYNDISIDIHGGWTYASDNNEYPVKSDDLWWIGFDCGHYNDGKDFELIKALATPEEYTHFVTMEKMFPTGGEVRTVEYVEQELRNAVKQLKG